MKVLLLFPRLLLQLHSVCIVVISPFSTLAFTLRRAKSKPHILGAMESADEQKAVDVAAPPSADTTPRPTSSISSGGIKRKATTTTSSESNKRSLTSTTSSSTTAAPFNIFEPVPPAACKPYKDCLLTHFFPTGRTTPASEHSLPGPQPASLTRGELHKIENGEYWVCEKSDGERTILLLQRDSKHVVLVDRKWSCRRMRQDLANVLIGLFATRGDTVVDAELIELAVGESGGERKEAEREGPLYRITMFDVLCFDGQRTADLMFGGRWNASNPPASDGSGRMDVLYDRIHKPYQQHMQPARQPAPGADAALTTLDAHFELHVKEFVAKHNAERILSRITHAPSSNPHFTHHTYTHGSRSNSNDGLIFTPDTADYYCRTTPLLKWKWPDLNTIDFTTYPPYTADSDRGLPLYCAGNTRRMDGGSGGGRGGGGNGLVKADILFDHIGALDEHSARSLDDVRRAMRGGGGSGGGGNSSQQAVLECGYSQQDSSWHVKTVRWDKSASNFLSTVVATMKAIMDDLQSSDIITACKKNKFTYRRK